MGFSTGSGEVCFNQAALDHKNIRAEVLRLNSSKKKTRDLCPDLKNIFVEGDTGQSILAVTESGTLEAELIKIIY